MTSVAICIPSGDHVLAECAYQLPAILGTASRAGIPCAVLNARSYSPAANLTGMNEAAMRNGFDAVLNLDADMLVPADVIPRLLAHEKAIVGAVYRNRGGERQIFGEKLDGSAFEPADEGLIEARWLPGGCILIRRAVLEAVPGRADIFDNGRLVRSHDVQFCTDARAAGFPIFAGMDVSRDTRHCGITPLGL